MSFTLPKNLQIYQTVFLALLLNAGILFFGLHFDYIKLFTVFASCIIFDTLLRYFQTREWSFPYSGVNAGFGISFFLRTDHLILYILAAFIAISSKHIFRIENRHFFNPSNFGVFLILMIFPLVSWTNPLQWGVTYGEDSIYYPLLISLIIVLGLAIIWRVMVIKGLNLLWIIVPFVVTHLFLYTFFTHEGFGYSFLKWYTPSFLIFTFFMITDPQTILQNVTSRVFFGSSIAIGVYVLQYFINENYSHLASLFCLTFIIPLIHHFDMKTIKGNVTYGNFIMGGIMVSLFILFVILVGIYGQPDLVYDNRCRALFCT